MDRQSEYRAKIPTHARRVTLLLSALFGFISLIVTVWSWRPEWLAIAGLKELAAFFETYKTAVSVITASIGALLGWWLSAFRNK